MLCPLLEKPRASLLCPCGRNRGQWGRGLFAANRRSGRKQQKRRRRQYQFWSADSRQSQIVPHLLFRVIEKKKICVKYANNQPSKRRKSSCHHVLCKAILEGELCVDVPKCHPLLQMGIKNQKLLKLHALQSRIFLLTQQLTREVCELIVYTACLSWLLKNNNCPQKNVACQLPIKSRRYRVIFVLLLRKKITIFEFYKKKKMYSRYKNNVLLYSFSVRNYSLSHKFEDMSLCAMWEYPCICMYIFLLNECTTGQGSTTIIKNALGFKWKSTDWWKIIFAKWELKGILKLSTSLLQDWI